MEGKLPDAPITIRMMKIIMLLHGVEPFPAMITYYIVDIIKLKHLMKHFFPPELTDIPDAYIEKMMVKHILPKPTAVD